MKTAGLLALMAHAAIPVPCRKPSSHVLDDVLADIGDTQSIEESLSSFSGHLLARQADAGSRYPEQSGPPR